MIGNLHHGLFGLLFFVATPAEANDETDRTFRYGCNDIVVIGRIASYDYTSLSDPGDVPGYGRTTATINVSRTIKGSRQPRQIRVDYVSHARIRAIATS